MSRRGKEQEVEAQILVESSVIVRLVAIMYLYYDQYVILNNNNMCYPDAQSNFSHA